MSVDDNSHEQNEVQLWLSERGELTSDQQSVYAHLYRVWKSTLKQCDDRLHILARNKLHNEKELNNIKELKLLISTFDATGYSLYLYGEQMRIEKEIDEIKELQSLLPYENNLIDAYNMYSEVRHQLTLLEAMEEFSIHHSGSFDNLLIILFRMERKRMRQRRRTA